MSDQRTTLWEIAGLFLRLGATAFGGPAAHLAMMQDEVVRRRRWLSAAGFLDLLGATNLIPGPNSTEMAIHIGWACRRWAGLVVAGLAFILPATLITGLCGWVYVRYGSVPTATWLLYGVKPVIIGIVIQAIWGLAPNAARTTGLRILCGVAAVLAALGVHELVVLFGAGVIAVVAARVRSGTNSGGNALYQVVPLLPVGWVKLTSLFGIFLKIGATLLGSGYVLVAFLRADLVQRLGWLTESQLMDAIAVGQMTPGPVFTTATFIGYVLDGPNGALVATAGIFLPAFVFVAISGPFIPRLRASADTSAFLDGVNVASLALMGIVTLQLGRTALVDIPTMILAVLACVLLVRVKLNSSWLLLSGAIIGWIVHAFHLAG